MTSCKIKAGSTVKLVRECGSVGLRGLYPLKDAELLFHCLFTRHPLILGETRKGKLESFNFVKSRSRHEGLFLFDYKWSGGWVLCPPLAFLGFALPYKRLSTLRSPIKRKLEETKDHVLLVPLLPHGPGAKPMRLVPSLLNINVSARRDHLSALLPSSSPHSCLRLNSRI